MEKLTNKEIDRILEWHGHYEYYCNDHTEEDKKLSKKIEGMKNE